MKSRYGSLGDWFMSQGLHPFECEEDVFDIAAHSSKYHVFRCERGHEFRQQPIHITEGMGCPYCKGLHRISKPEMCIHYAFRDKCRMQLQYRLKYNPRKSVDIVFVDWNLGIEYDGQRWHKDPWRDIEKDRLAFGEGLNLIHIREPGCVDIPSFGYYKIPKPVSRWQDMVSVIGLIDDILGGGYCRMDIESVWNEMIRDLWNGTKLNSVHDFMDCMGNDIDLYADVNEMDPNTVSISDGQMKVWWTCRRCGRIYSCTPHNLKSSRNGSRCPFCSGRIVTESNSMAAIHPELEMFYSGFNEIPYLDVSVGSDKKRIWTCKNGHYFEAAPSHIHGVNGTWCPICSNNVILPRFNDLGTIDPYLSEFIFLAGGNPEKLAKNDKKLRLFKCPCCGYEWMDSVFKRRPRKKICPVCGCTRSDVFS